MAENITRRSTGDEFLTPAQGQTLELFYTVFSIAMYKEHLTGRLNQNSNFMKSCRYQDMLESNTHHIFLVQLSSLCKSV